MDDLKPQEQKRIDGFKIYLESMCQPNTSKLRYYKYLLLLRPIILKWKSIDILTDEVSLEQLKAIYDFVLDEQNKIDKGIFKTINPPSYHEKRFYSAALNAYISFLFDNKNDVNATKYDANNTNNCFENEEDKHLLMSLKSVEKCPLIGGRDLNVANDPLMLRLMASLRTKPFVILAGHSGTGKSRMVRKLAYMTCCDETLRKTDRPGNFCMIQVKPNWHDSTDLLGYYSALSEKYESTDFIHFICKAYAYPEVPFFVCLDEMNLAPVEQYFAEYLSAIESAKEINNIRITDELISKKYYKSISNLGVETKEAANWISKYGLTIPKNLFIVGTVNMDETTCQFSRKVLDRAMTIEMNEVSFENFGQVDIEPSYKDTLKPKEVSKLLSGASHAERLSDNQKIILKSLQKTLASTPFVVAYRFANEFALYTESLNLFGGGGEDVAFDHLILMKVLPRISGEKSIIERIFNSPEKGLKKLLNDQLANSQSRKKIDEMIASTDSYLSFWP